MCTVKFLVLVLAITTWQHTLLTMEYDSYADDESEKIVRRHSMPIYSYQTSKEKTENIIPEFIMPSIKPERSVHCVWQTKTYVDGQALTRVIDPHGYYTITFDNSLSHVYTTRMPKPLSHNEKILNTSYISIGNLNNPEIWYKLELPEHSRDVVFTLEPHEILVVLYTRIIRYNAHNQTMQTIFSDPYTVYDYTISPSGRFIMLVNRAGDEQYYFFATLIDLACATKEYFQAHKRVSLHETYKRYDTQVLFTPFERTMIIYVQSQDALKFAIVDVSHNEKQPFKDVGKQRYLFFYPIAANNVGYIVLLNKISKKLLVHHIYENKVYQMTYAHTPMQRMDECIVLTNNHLVLALNKHPQSGNVQEGFAIYELRAIPDEKGKIWSPLTFIAIPTVGVKTKPIIDKIMRIFQLWVVLLHTGKLIAFTTDGAYQELYSTKHESSKTYVLTNMNSIQEGILLTGSSEKENVVTRECTMLIKNKTIDEEKIFEQLKSVAQLARKGYVTEAVALLERIEKYARVYALPISLVHIINCIKDRVQTELVEATTLHYKELRL